MPKGVYTLQSRHNRRRFRTHGFFTRMRNHAGRIIKLRRLKGRKRLTVA